MSGVRGDGYVTDRDKFGIYRKFYSCVIYVKKDIMDGHYKGLSSAPFGKKFASRHGDFAYLSKERYLAFLSIEVWYRKYYAY